MDAQDEVRIDARLRSRAEELAAEFADSSSTAADLNQLMRLMMKAGLERMLNTEIDVHLGRRGAPPEGAPAMEEGPPNRRNGSSKKTVQGELGGLTLQTPRDRAGTFEPVIVGKHQRRTTDFDAKTLALFAGHDAAAENHARLWSLIASCERHGIDPQRYLTSVLSKIRRGGAKIGHTSASELEQFLPDVWKAEDTAEPVELP